MLSFCLRNFCCCFLYLLFGIQLYSTLFARSCSSFGSSSCSFAVGTVAFGSAVAVSAVASCSLSAAEVPPTGSGSWWALMENSCSSLGMLMWLQKMKYSLHLGQCWAVVHVCTSTLLPGWHFFCSCY